MHVYPPPKPWPPAVREFIETSSRECAEDIAYSRMQATRPRTVAYGLTDSPAGLAAWIVDLFRAFSDWRRRDRGTLQPRPDPHQLTIYWVTASIGPVMRGCSDFDHFAAPRPVAASRFPPGLPSSPTATARAAHALRANSPSTSTSRAGPRCREGP